MIGVPSDNYNSPGISDVELESAVRADDISVLCLVVSRFNDDRRNKGNPEKSALISRFRICQKFLINKGEVRQIPNCHVEPKTEAFGAVFLDS
jgi:hypothetical protein